MESEIWVKMSRRGSRKVDTRWEVGFDRSWKQRREGKEIRSEGISVDNIVVGSFVLDLLRSAGIDLAGRERERKRKGRRRRKRSALDSPASRSFERQEIRNRRRLTLLRR